MKTRHTKIFGNEELYGRLLVAALCAMPLLAMYAPRSTAIGPPLIALVAFIFHYAVFHQWPRIPRKVLVWALAFPALMAASYFWSIAPDHAVSRAAKALPLLLSGAVLWSLGHNLNNAFAARFRGIFPYIAIAMGILCGIELYADAPVFRLIHNFVDNGEKFRAAQVNRSIVVLVPVALTGFFCIASGGAGAQQKKILYIILGLLCAIALYKTDSQSAQLAFILGLGFYFFFPYAKRWAWELLCALVAAGIFAAPWIATTVFRYVAFNAQSLPLLEKGYAGQRFEIWDFIARAAFERPWLGYGVEATREMTFDSRQMFYPALTILHPHNFALQAWIEFGLLGAFVLALFLCTLIRGMRRLEPDQARLVLPLLIASLSVASTGYGLWQGWWLGLFCLLFGYAALLTKKK